MIKKIVFIILLLLGLTITILMISQSTIFNSRASNTNSHIPVKENSYIFASPIQAKADGHEKIRITVFLLDSQGLGVSQQNITLQVPPNLQIETIQNITDELGKATFNLSSNSPGKFEISASSPSLKLSQKINLLFL